MGYNVAPADVRRLIGITSSDISDADLNSIITDAEVETDRVMNTTFTPKLAHKFLTSYDRSEVMRVPDKPVTRLRNVVIDGSAVSINTVKLYKDTGKLELTNDSEKTRFNKTEPLNNVVRYDYGYMDDTTTETTLTAWTGSGSRVNMPVQNSSGINVNDYVKVEGFDFSEVALVTGTAGSLVAVDLLSLPHENASRVIKLQVPQVITNLVLRIAGIFGAIRMQGGTYSNSLTYQVPEYSTTRESALAHFTDVIKNLQLERDRYVNMFGKKVIVMS